MAAELMAALKLFEIVMVAAPWVLDAIREGREVEVAAALATCRPRSQQDLEDEVNKEEQRP